MLLFGDVGIPVKNIITIKRNTVKNLSTNKSCFCIAIAYFVGEKTNIEQMDYDSMRDRDENFHRYVDYYSRRLLC